MVALMLAVATMFWAHHGYPNARYTHETWSWSKGECGYRSSGCVNHLGDGHIYIVRYEWNKMTLHDKCLFMIHEDGHADRAVALPDADPTSNSVMNSFPFSAHVGRCSRFKPKALL